MKTNGIIRIERGIPIPQARGTRKYPWAKLKVGDSFVIPVGLRASIGTAASRYGYKMATRKISATEARAWRVK